MPIHQAAVGLISIFALASCSGPSLGTSDSMGSTLDIVSGRLPVAGGEIYYEVVGWGEPIVLIHGNAGDLRHWDLQTETLAQRYRVVRYDVRGFGRSTDPAEGEPFSNHGDLAALLNHLEISRAHVAGWSMGSGIAIDFGLAYPEMTMSLISVGPWVAGYSSDAASQMFSDMRAVRQAARDEGNAAAVDAWMAAPFFDATIRDPRAGNRFRYIASAQSFLPSDGPNRREGLRPPAAGRMAELDVPMLIVTAEHDIPACVEIADLLERTVPEAQRVTMAGTGHLMHMERPDMFNAIVLDFLESVGGG